MDVRSQSATVVAAIFGAGALVAVIVYALASVYLFDFYEVRWGRGGSFQVVLMLGFVIAIISAVAFGAVLGLSAGGVASTVRRAYPFVLGVLVMALGTGLALLTQRWLGASLLWVASSFMVCSIIAALVFGRLMKQGAHAAG